MADLGREIREFVRFPISLVQNLMIRPPDKAILSESGLPNQASPFLSFGLSPKDMLQRLSDGYGLDASYDRYSMIGHNGSGDMICIDEQNEGSVVYLNHDNNMQVVFMNSSVTALAECLCILAVFMRSKDATECRDALQRADSSAMRSGTFWPNEID
ncbi:MAG: SUKH-4 family immunity protein [Planctomycetia bacterium]|nr:SUKH-4 family immunity protein [Planctomycetia bacterium]